MSKTVVVVLVALVVAGVVAVTAGAGQGSGRAGDEPFADRLADLAGDTGGVAVRDLTADCLTPVAGDPGRLVVSGPCAVGVEASDGAGLRLLRITATDRVVVRAPAPDPDADVTMEATLEPGDETTVGVSGDGAVIALSCPGLAVECGAVLDARG